MDGTVLAPLFALVAGFGVGSFVAFGWSDRKRSGLAAGSGEVSEGVESEAVGPFAVDGPPADDHRSTVSDGFSALAPPVGGTESDETTRLRDLLAQADAALRDARAQRFADRRRIRELTGELAGDEKGSTP